MWKKSDNKKPKEELQEYLKFRNRGSKIPNKKAYTRKEKHKSKKVLLSFLFGGIIGLFGEALYVLFSQVFFVNQQVEYQEFVILHPCSKH